MNETPELFSGYFRMGCEQAFREKLSSDIVALVYSLRRYAKWRVNSHLAQTSRKTVFTDFVAQGFFPAAEVVLAGWLYHHTCLKAAQAVRTECRHRGRDKSPRYMNSLHQSEEDPIWHDVAPLLDRAMDQLSASDRDTLVLRFFQNASLRAVGDALA